MDWDAAKKQAMNIMNQIITKDGEPIGSRDRAIELIATALIRSHAIGWDDKYRQLASAMYPRGE